MQGILLQIGYFERGLSKSLKKLTLLFFRTACHLHVTRMFLYVMRMSLEYTRMSFVCHSYVLVCHPYVTRMYSYVIPMSLVRTRISSVVTRMWFYHGPQIIGQLTMTVVELFTTCIHN